MGNECRKVAKALPTLTAGVGFLPSVGPMVGLEVCEPIKALPTLSAWVRSVLLMDSAMSHEFLLLQKAFPTVPAPVGFLQPVNTSLMAFQFFCDLGSPQHRVLC